MILPIGATEQHALHICRGRYVFGNSRCSLAQSKKWAGTISLRSQTLAAIIVEIAEWVASAGFSRLLLNGHATNWAPLRCGLENVRHRYPELRTALRFLRSCAER